MKNTLLALLGFILFSTPLAATAQAVDGFTYSSDGSAITITRYYGPGGAVNIPSAINGVPVTTIGPNAFYNQIGLTSVTLPGTVTSIEDSAFGGCSNLTSVNIPGSVTNIGNAAFWACTSLTTVTIPAAVSRIGGGAFQSSGLTSITIPGTVRTIEDYAFSFCSNLMAIIVNAMNPSYSSLDGVLFNKSQTTLLTFPGGKDGSYTIPASVTAISDNAFALNTSLATVTISTSVSSMRQAAFWGCSSLMAIAVDPANASYSSLDGVVFNKSQTTLLTFPGGKGGSYTIPTNVTTIGVSAFELCTKLTSVTVPDSVTSIESFAFGTCTSLTNFNIPTNVTRIGPFTFIGCGSLTSVTIPGNVRTIEDNAFSFCSNLTSVTISEGVTGILFQTFYRSDKLTNMVIPRSVTSIVRSPFPTGPGLQGLFFKGNAPIVLLGLTLATNTTVYYLPGATGWGATFGGVPARLWNPRIQTSGPNFGVGPAGFGFNITGTTNIPIVVESSANLGNDPWIPWQSLNLTNGSFHFNDPSWTNFPCRTYRIRSP